MKYRILSKRLSKWERLTKLYAKKARQSKEREGCDTVRLTGLYSASYRIHHIYIDKYVNHCQSKGR